MPKIKRWFPVNQSINHDPEIWELTHKFGDRALRVWLELLSVGDRNEGVLKGSIESWASVFMTVYSERNPRWIGRDLDTIQSILRWMVEKGWIVLRDGSETAQSGFRRLSERSQKAIRGLSSPSLIVTNYAKYHRSWELDSLPISSLPSDPILPILSEPKIKIRVKTKIPPAFAVGDKHRQWANENGLPDPDSQLEAFRDHHTAKGSVFLDWDAAFRTWIRNSPRFGNGSGKGIADKETAMREKTARALRQGL